MDKGTIELIKEIIEEEIMRDFETRRIHPYSRHRHLIDHIFFKIDNLNKEKKENEQETT